jgi:hypothetical protein
VPQWDSNPCLVTVAFSPYFSAASALLNLRKLDGPQTRTKAVPLKQLCRRLLGWPASESGCSVNQLYPLYPVYAPAGEKLTRTRPALIGTAHDVDRADIVGGHGFRALASS